MSVKGGMQVPLSGRPLWDTFQATRREDLKDRFYEQFYFGDSPEMGTQLAALVLAGTKQATAGLLWGLEPADKRPPRPGDLSIMTNGAEEPLGIIATTEVRIVPFDQVSAEFASLEGEGDRTLRHWREVHWAYFERECRALGREPSLDMPVVCERFELVFQGR